MEGFPSGQREQTVNLSSMTSVVRIHHLPPKQKDIPKGMSFFCFGGRWLWIRKVALRNSPVGCFNHRGFTAAKRIHHRTGRHACGSKTMELHQPIPAGTRPIRRNAKSAHTRFEGKNRLFDNEIHLSKETSHRRAGCPQPALCSDVQMVYTVRRGRRTLR